MLVFVCNVGRGVIPPRTSPGASWASSSPPRDGAGCRENEKSLFVSNWGIRQSPSHLLVYPPPCDEPLPPSVQFLLDGGEADGADLATVLNRGLNCIKKIVGWEVVGCACRVDTCSFQRAMSPGIGGKNMSVTYFSSWVSSSELRSCFPSNTWQIIFGKSSRTTFTILLSRLP